MGNFGKSYGQICDENHIKQALEWNGHEVFSNDDTKIPEVDLILCFKSNVFGAVDVERWKTLTKAPVFIWTFDNMDRFQWFYEIAKKCDLWLGEELGRKDRFKQDGIPFYYFPNHAVLTNYFYPISMTADAPIEKKYDVMFSGTDYFPERIEMLREVVFAGFNLHIFGNSKESWERDGLPNVHGPAFDIELAKVISESKIVLGISNTYCPGYWSIRAAQVMLSGGFIIEKYVPGMEKELKDGVEYWSDHEELIEKIRYYLEHEEERNAISMKGYQIATNNSTNQQRCKELIIIFERFKKIGSQLYA